MKPINHTTKISRFTVPALALVLTSALYAAPSHAAANTADDSPTKTAATRTGHASDPLIDSLMKFSQDGGATIRDVHGARLAIFNGDPKAATSLLSNAKTAIAAAKKDASTFEGKTTLSMDGKVVATKDKDQKAVMVPFDAQIMLAEDFVATPEKKTHLDKANQHFKNGEKKEALEELRLGEIDANFKRWWLPISATEKQVDQAIHLIQTKKYYEANLALKSVEDSITVEAVSERDVLKK